MFAVLCALVGLPPRVDTSAAALLPDGHPQGQTLHDLAQHPGATGALVLAVEADRDALDEAVAQLEALPAVLDAQHSLDPTRLTTALLQLPPERVAQLTDRLEGVLAMGPALNPFVAASLLGEEDLAELRRPEGARIWVVPRHHSLDADACLEVVRQVRASMASLPGVEVIHMGGPYANVAIGAEAVNRDLPLTSAVSLVLVLLILSVGLRSLWSPLMIAVPLTVAALAHLATLRLLFGTTTGFAMIGTAVLFGLGVDMAIHLVERVRSELGRRHTFDDALSKTWDTTGPACVVATITSCASFAALSLGDFRGLAQLGGALAISLLVAAALMLVCLPPLLGWLHRRGALRPLALPTSRADRSVPRGAALAFLVLTAVVALVGSRHIAFEYDFSALGTTAHRYDGKSERLRAAMDTAEPPMVAPAEAYEHVEALRAAGSLDGIARVVRTETVLPPDQDERLAALKQLGSLATHPGARRLPPAVQRGLAELAALPLTPLGVADLPVELRGVLESEHLVMLSSRSLHDMRESSALLDALAEAAPTATGVRLLQGASYQTILADLPRITGAAFVAIVLFAIAGLRRWRAVGLALAAVLVGGAWSLGAVSALGIRLTAANLVGFPILIGVGIDVAIHMVHRMGVEGRSYHDTVRTVGRAAALSTATTAASFGAVSLASSGGLRSLGLLVGVGLPVMTLGSLALLALVRRELP